MKKQKRWIAIILSMTCIFAVGCENSAESSSDSSVTTTLTEAASTTTTEKTETEIETEALETKVETEANEATETEDEIESEVTETETEITEVETIIEEATEAPESLQIYTADAYGCTIEIPEGWAATTGVSGTEITEEASIFEPSTGTGDSIALLIQAGADTAEDFAAITQEVIATALESYMSDVTVTDWVSLTIDGCDAYYMQIDGTIESMAVSMEQLVVNCTDAAYGDYQYSLTYTNISGDSSPYAKTLDAYFHLGIE